MNAVGKRRKTAKARVLIVPFFPLLKWQTTLCLRVTISFHYMMQVIKGVFFSCQLKNGHGSKTLLIFFKLAQ
jgi:hypothetical protein